MAAFLEWSTVVLPTLFGLAMEIVGSRTKKHWAWRISVVAFGMGLSTLVYYQQHLSRKASAEEKQTYEADRRKDREAIEKLTSQVTELLKGYSQPNLEEFSKLHQEIAQGFRDLHSALQSVIPNIPKPVPREAGIEKPPIVPEHIRFVTKRIPSPNNSLPYGMQIVLQTDAAMEPTGFAIQCTDEIGDAHFFLAGQTVLIQVLEGFADERKTFLFQFSLPPFSPDSPIVVTLLSKTALSVRAVKLWRFR